MQALLLSRRGTRLRVDDRELLVVEPRGAVNAVVGRYKPYRADFDQVLVEENGGYITFGALRWLSVQGISFAGVEFNGRLTFATVPSAPSSGPVKLAQYRAANDERRRLAIAHALVRARLGSAAAVVNKSLYDANRPMPKDFEQLRGFEGRAEDVFMREYAHLVNAVWPESGFDVRAGTSRLNQNAVNGPNCLLNFGFAVLSARVLTALVRAGFDPLIPFYHRPGWAEHNPPLARDLIEPFRFLVELAVLDTLRAKKFSGRDFTVTSALVFRLGSEAKRLLLDRLAARLNRKTRYGGTLRTAETIMLREFGRLADHVKGPATRFEFQLPVAEMVGRRSSPFPNRSGGP